MREGDRLRAENDSLRERLSKLTEAILRISEDLDLDTVLQEIVDSACSLTDARYSAITTIDEVGTLQDVLIPGLTPAQRESLMVLPGGWDLLGYLSTVREPLRTRDFVSHVTSRGLPAFDPPIGTFLGIQIRDGDRHIGNIYIAEKEGGRDFTQEDEETLQMFASQAAMAITNARRYGAEQRLSADLEALINTSPVGVLVFDAKTGHLMKLNQEARRILGVASGEESSFEDHLGSITFRHMDGREIPRHQLPVERSVRVGEMVRAEEVTIQLPDGESVTTLFNSTPIYSDDGDIVSAVATIQDITPLEELERLRAEFLGMVSHELRMPLTSIKGSAATARNASVPIDPAETQQFFRIIEEQADHMRDLINNLLDLTRIEAGRLSVVPEPTDLTSIIEQARNALQSSGFKNSIQVDLTPDIPLIAADRQRLVQVLYNLFSNASKFSREWSTIRVTASLENLYAVISVADEGVGVPTEQLPHLFRKFSRVESDEDNRRSEGYGLGLAICKGIVEAHGGRIWVDSDGHGQGTRFTFTIPTIQDEGANAAAYQEAAFSSSGPARLERVLVVDDNQQILRLVRNTLSEAGYAPILTSDPSEMSHLLKEEDPQLVLLNLVLPGRDGFELMKDISNMSDVPVIFVSGRGRGQDVARAFELGAADYVVKPFSPTELVARISAALRRRTVEHRTESYLLGDLVIDYVEGRVTMAGRPLQLTPTEYKLLCELSAGAGRVVPHGQLLQRVWGDSSSEDHALLRSCVKNLRQKLGDDARNPSYIITVPRTGYRMAAQ